MEEPTDKTVEKKVESHEVSITPRNRTKDFKCLYCITESVIKDSTVHKCALFERIWYAHFTLCLCNS